MLRVCHSCSETQQHLRTDECAQRSIVMATGMVVEHLKAVCEHALKAKASTLVDGTAAGLTWVHRDSDAIPFHEALVLQFVRCRAGAPANVGQDLQRHRGRDGSHLGTVECLHRLAITET